MNSIINNGQSTPAEIRIRYLATLMIESQSHTQLFTL